MEFTLQEVEDKEAKLKEIDAELHEALQQQQEAKLMGDFSENAELESSTAKVKELQRIQAELISQLSDYTIIKPDNGPRFSIGNYVTFFKVGDNKEQLSEPRTLRLAAEGDTINKNTLGVLSPLGKAILNGTDGIYTIQTSGGVIRYNVKKERQKS